MMKKVIPGLFLLCTCIVTPAQAGNISSAQVGEWLERLAMASRSLNYEGTFVYHHGMTLESVHLVHMVDQKGEHERIISLNGTAREIIRNNNQTTCILPDSKSVLVDNTSPGTGLPSFPTNIDKISRYYEFEFEGYGRVAGRPVRQIMIRPKDEFRYGYRLWLDDAFELLLRSELLDGQGNVVEQVMFTDIRLLENMDAERLKPNIAENEYKWVTDDEPVQRLDVSKPDWHAEKLPGGFVLTRDSMQRLPEHNVMVNHLLFSDGLASVSVYVEPVTAGEDVLRGNSQMGAVNAYGRVIDEYHVTAVGEVPAGTVEMIASSLRHMKGNGQ